VERKYRSVIGKLIERACIIGMTVMLSGTLFMSMLAEMMPTTSEAIPLLGEFEQRRAAEACIGEQIHTDSSVTSLKFECCNCACLRFAGTFFAATMWLSAVSVVASIYILLLHHNEAIEPIQGIVQFHHSPFTFTFVHHFCSGEQFS
jgi:hypothetical protein